jgi:GH15 family glucan-1,4-alpha-glucosidase
MVVEFATDRSNKGLALELLRRKVGATAVLFVGDDLTDEHGFAVLIPGDVGVKVGPGESRAGHRLDDVDEVALLLARIAQERAQWLGGRKLVSLNALSIVSDLRTTAVVDDRGRIVWLCVPRLDSPPLFASLLGSEEHGCFGICPSGDHGASEAGPVSQQFEPDTLVLRTNWQSITVTDYFDCGGGRAFQRAGRTDLIRVIEGSGRAKVTFSPRLDFGRSPTRISLRESGLEIEGGMDSIVLHAPEVEWTIRSEGRHQSAEATVSLEGGPIVLELRYGTPNSRPHPRPESLRRAETSLFWSNWCKSLRVPGSHAATLRQSALMLRALCYGPTGAIAAAATTSLPEHLGGSRNWDYRFCWPRDAALACSALLRLGNTGTALRFLDWLAAVVDRCESPDRLRPVYTLTGADLGPEGEVGELPGYGGSKPVRVGNAAAQQVQLDVFGPIVDLIASLAEHGAPLSAEHWRLVRSMVSAVEARWQEQDHGIWELRGPKRHHVHTKAMCFLTVDRAITLHKLETGKDQPRWTELRELIRADVLAHGYCQQAGCFTTAYGSAEPDAAALAVGLVGLVSESDARWRATVDCVARTLRTGPVVLRYRFDDELAGREGGFHLCTSWLIRAMLSLDRIHEARDLLDGMLACVGPRGVLTEQFDARYEIALGNLPQAYSHLALINSILDVEVATLHGSKQP